MTATAPAASAASNLPAHPPAASRQQTTAALLTKVRQTYLAIDTEWNRINEEFRAAATPNGNQPSFLYPPGIREAAPATEEARERAITRLIDQAVAQPCSTEAKALLRSMEAALDAGFISNQARLIVALMIDAYPNARMHSPDAYIASIMDVLAAEDVSNAAIAIACNEMKTTTTFLPALAEVLEAVRKAEKYLWLRRDRLTKYLDWTERNDAACAWLRTVPLATDGNRVPFEGNDPF